MNPDTKACLYAGVTALMWSTIACAFKLALTALDPWQLVFWSSLTATLFLAAILVVDKKITLVIPQFHNARWLYLILGFLNPFLYHLCLFGAYDLLPAQQAQALNYSWPMALTLLAVPFLGNTLSLKDSLCCLAAYAGVLVICTHGKFQYLDLNSPAGVVLAIASTLIWAGYWILNTRKKDDPVTGLLICFLMGMPWIIIATSYFSSIWPVPVPGLGWAIYIGLVEMGIAYIFWLQALKLARNTAAVSNISYLSPFLSLIFISTILGETIQPATYVGLTMIISSVIIQQAMAGKSRHL